MTTTQIETGLPALVKTCPACEGEGVYYCDEWRAWNERWQSAHDAEARRAHNSYEESNLKPLEAAERAAGPQPSGPEELPCGECNGSGFVPTIAGRQILKLMRTCGPEP